MNIDDFGSVSLESIMDTVTRVYLSIAALGIAVQIIFPFYNTVNTRKTGVTTALQNYSKTYLHGLCFNQTGNPQYGGCPTPVQTIIVTPTPT